MNIIAKLICRAAAVIRITKTRQQEHTSRARLAFSFSFVRLVCIVIRNFIFSCRCEARRKNLFFLNGESDAGCLKEKKMLVFISHA